MKVLLGWELGGGQGHIQLLAALAQILETQGLEPVFALKSYNIKGISFPWQTVLAPRLLSFGRHESYTFADILETFGFGNANLLRSHLQAWRSVLEEVKPNLIIAEHAPGLVLAAFGLVPTVVLGNGTKPSLCSYRECQVSGRKSCSLEPKLHGSRYSNLSQIFG